MTSDVLPVQHQRGAPWWLLLLQGIAALLVGLLLLAAPLGSTVFIIQFLGWYWLIGGTFSIVGIFWTTPTGVGSWSARHPRWVCRNHPLWATVLVPTTLVWVMGFWNLHRRIDADSGVPSEGVCRHSRRPEHHPGSAAAYEAVRRRLACPVLPSLRSQAHQFDRHGVSP